MDAQDSKCVMIPHADGHGIHTRARAHTHTRTESIHVNTQLSICVQSPRNDIGASVYLVKGEMGRAGSVLSAYFSKTINSVHKTHWSKTLKGKKVHFLAAGEITLWQTARFKVSINAQNKASLSRPLL